MLLALDYFVLVLPWADEKDDCRRRAKRRQSQASSARSARSPAVPYPPNFSLSHKNFFSRMEDPCVHFPGV
jgi:hypothetical protein